jgi:hypothetical protein
MENKDLKSLLWELARHYSQAGDPKRVSVDLAILKRIEDLERQLAILQGGRQWQLSIGGK